MANEKTLKSPEQAAKEPAKPAEPGKDAGVAPAAVAEPKWSDNQLRQAEELGLNPEDAVGLGDPDRVLAAISAVHRKHAAKPVESTTEVKPKKADLKALRDAGFDDVADVLEGVTGDVTEVRELVNDLKAQRERDKEVAENEWKDRVESLIDGLGESHDDKFGDSTRMSGINRKKVRNEMKERAEWYRSRKRPVPNDSALLRESMNFIWPESDPKSADSTSTKSPTTIRQPSHVTGDDKRSPREKAIAAIRQFKADNGYS